MHNLLFLPSPVDFVHPKAACSSLVMLSLGWIIGLWHYQSIALLGWPLPPRGNSNQNVQSLEVLSFQDSLRATPTNDFFQATSLQKFVQRSRKSQCAYTSRYSTAHEQRSFRSPFFKNKAPTLFCAPPTTFFFQETCNFDSAASTRPTYDVACKGCPQRYQGPGVQKVSPTRMPSGTVRTRKWFHPRNGFSPQKRPESENNY